MKYPRKGDIRYFAEWLKSYGDQPGPDFIPENCIYEKKQFSTPLKCAEYAIKHDLNQEGTVNTYVALVGGIAPCWSLDHYEPACEVLERFRDAELSAKEKS